ncbi:MAG: hypothetical protein DMF04_10270 [Verrucomicrobia bacterium]|nr:MAG: hypothetical protein DMF04_10270 [Verrucomicrobiota bacterium]
MKEKIPFTVASDAHSWAQLGENYDRLSQKISSFGIHQIHIYEKHKRRRVMTHSSDEARTSDE